NRAGACRGVVTFAASPSRRGDVPGVFVTPVVPAAQPHVLCNPLGYKGHGEGAGRPFRPRNPPPARTLGRSPHHPAISEAATPSRGRIRNGRVPSTSRQAGAVPSPGASPPRPDPSTEP